MRSLHAAAAAAAAAGVVVPTTTTALYAGWALRGRGSCRFRAGWLIGVVVDVVEDDGC